MAAAPVVESADVQLEHGFVRLANRLVEALCDADFTGTQTKIVLALWRDTYGWGQEAVRLTVNQLAQRCRCVLAGGFHRALNELAAEGVVILVVPRSPQSPGGYMVQKDFTKWGRFSVSEARLAAIWERPDHLPVQKVEAKPKAEKKVAASWPAKAVEIWATERDGAILDFGIAGKHLQPVVKLLGEEEALSRWVNYCQRTKGDGWASPSNFKAHHPEYAHANAGGAQRPAATSMVR